MARRRALAAAAALLATGAAFAQPTDPGRAAEDEAILAGAGIVLPCRSGPFIVSAPSLGEGARNQFRTDYLLLTGERRRIEARVSMTIQPTFRFSDGDVLATNHEILEGLVGPLTPVRDYSGAPGPEGAVGRLYRFQSRGNPAMVGAIVWRRGNWRIEIHAWAYGARLEAVWADIERLVRDIATPREPRGGVRRCPSRLDARPVPIPG